MDFIDQLRIPSDEVEMIAIDQGYFESDSKPIEFVDTDQISLQKILTFVEKIQDLDEKYILGRTIGVGEFARVKIATCVADGQTVAIKLVELPEGSKQDDRLCREVENQMLPTKLALIMEYIDGGELFNHVQRHGFLPESEVRGTIVQILKAVEFMHANRIVHRDLKLENILRDNRGRIYVSDFGFSRKLPNYGPPDSLMRTSCGSPCYAAPELVLNKKGYVGPPVDIWSCGVIFYACSYGHLPFEGGLDLERDPNTGTISWTHNNVYQLYFHIANHSIRLPCSSGNLSFLGQDLLTRMLDPDPDTRINFPEIWRHAWFHQPYVRKKFRERPDDLYQTSSQLIYTEDVNRVAIVATTFHSTVMYHIPL